MTITVIKNARIVNEGRITEGDLKIRDGRIDAIASRIATPSGASEIDAAGAYLIPGMIDDQVHFREPGFEHKGTIATESRAARSPAASPATWRCRTAIRRRSRDAALRDKHTRAARVSLANYAFYLGATNDNLEVVKSVDASLACGVKVFMGASTGNMLVDNPATLEGIFAGTPLLIATHCEDTPTIQANEARARARYGDDIPVTEHPNIRSVEACFKSSSMAVDLAKRHGTRLHILHLTTAREMALFEPGLEPEANASRPRCARTICSSTTRGTRRKATTSNAIPRSRAPPTSRRCSTR